MDGLEVFARHGVYESERREGNRFRIDLCLYLVRKRDSDDDSSPAADYEKAVQIAAKVMNGEPKKLVETLAEAIAALLLEEMENVARVRVRLAKLSPPVGADCAAAGIEIVRERQGV